MILLLVIIAALLPSAMAADPITDKVYQIVHYAEQYEMGQISYPELKIYSNSLREDIREMMGEMVLGEENEHFEGVTPEAAEKFFGEPTEYTNWLWLSNEEKEIRVDEKMPRWEKVVFDGKKIQITFNAWPQIYKGKDGEKKFYWVDFNIRFKKQFNFDLGQMQSDIKGQAVSYLNTKSNKEEFANKLVEYSQMLQQYMEQNRENCNLMLSKFFSSSDKSMEQEMIKWETVLYEGERFTLIAMTQLCENCEWTWANTWLEPRYDGPGFKGFEGGKGEADYDREELKEKEIPELLSMLKEELEKARKAAANSDDGRNFNPQAHMGNFDAIYEALSQNYNWDERSREENRQKYISAIDNILSGYGKNEKMKIRELRYERRLVEDMIEKNDKWCRMVQQEECAIEEGCIGGECRFALGGDEDCGNEADDDGDTLVDCRDPDCARDCGKLCQDVCQEGCWPCMQPCQKLCKECDECRKDGGEGEACKDVCARECDTCRNDNCWDQAVCSECKACENAGKEGVESCDMECGPCKQCTKTKDAELCEQECSKCVECKTPDVNPKCEEGCKKIIQDDRAQLETCLGLCRQNVIFYCSGSKQYSPCEDTTYICNGNPQLTPCLIYTCEGDIKQNVPCGQEAFCGENQIAEGERCKCRAGWYDCDRDGKSCESNVQCSDDMEICDDKMDNDDDYMIDCEDRMDCREGTICAIGKVCFDGGLRAARRG
ncbi:MAG: hypothetical protein ABIB71_02070 [Candidatus Woesearchaeota archaeon]